MSFMFLGFLLPNDSPFKTSLALKQEVCYLSSHFDSLQMLYPYICRMYDPSILTKGWHFSLNDIFLVHRCLICEAHCESANTLQSLFHNFIYGFQWAKAKHTVRILISVMNNLHHGDLVIYCMSKWCTMSDCRLYCFSSSYRRRSSQRENGSLFQY